METKNKNIIYTDNKKVKCSGSSQELGHPLVYLNIKKERIVCPYCSIEFVYKESTNKNNFKVR